VLTANILVENSSDGLHRRMVFREGLHELPQKSALKPCKTTSSLLTHKAPAHFMLKDMLGDVKKNLHLYRLMVCRVRDQYESLETKINVHSGTD
jgi:hypothetical protein